MGYYERIAAFLSNYVKSDAGPGVPPIPQYIRSAIKIILDGKVMTADEMRRECLAEFDAIISWEFFPDDVIQAKMGDRKG